MRPTPPIRPPRSLKRPPRSLAVRLGTIACTVLFVALHATVTAQDAPPAVAPLDLFDQAAFRLALYAGPSEVRPRDLLPDARARLEAICATTSGCSERDAIDAIDTVTSALEDGHTGWIPAPDFEQLKLELGGGAEVDGFGVLLAPPENALGLVVLDVLPGGPGAAMGLERGDRILAIDGAYLPANPWTRLGAWVEAEMRGTATVSYLRAGRAPAQVELVAAPLLVDRPPSLTMLAADTAWLRIPSFVPDGVAQLVHDRILDAQVAGATNLIIDLRDNPGGLAIECLAAAGAFTDTFTLEIRGALLSQQVRWSDGAITFIDRAGRAFPQPPLDRPARWTGRTVVLVNAWSASCAEQMAYTLQRHADVPVLGEDTYGVLDSTTAFFALSNGMGMAVSMSVIADENGMPLPMRVTPDRYVEDNLLALSEGRDVPLIEARREVSGP